MKPKSNSQNLIDEEYLRECTLRSRAFIIAKRDFLQRWQSELDDLFAEPIVVARKAERGKGLDAIREQQRKQGQFWSELVKFCNDWPSITPGDVIGGASTPPGPKVRVAFHSRAAWPRDGSLLLLVDPTTTGEEIKQQWQKIKSELGLTKRRLRGGERRLKLDIYDMYYQDGKGFSQIARIVGKRRSTVISLYDSVFKDIHGVKPGSQRRVNLEKFVEHYAGCPSCRSQWECPLGGQLLGLKQTRGREILYGDISKAEVRQLRAAQGRKPKLSSKKEDES